MNCKLPIRVALPVMLAIAAALSGCTAGPGLAPPGLSCDAASAGPPARWWAALGDAPLSALIERAPAQPADIARMYIDLRAQQTALVLLARREESDRQLVIAEPPNTAAQARFTAKLGKTRADQAQTRGRIAALREALAALDGLGPHALDDMPGGPIPLPPLASSRNAAGRCGT